MLVLCGECNKHYDDSSQSDECSGLGPQPDEGGPHKILRPSPIEDHVDNIRRSRPDYVNPRGSRG